jgi:hypothetical protein
MKKRFYIQLIIALTLGSLHAQEDCTNGTHTDPSPGQGHSTPANNTYKENKFDWRQQSWYSWMHYSSNTFMQQYTNNPYFSASYPFSYYGASDFKPESGWELVKQDMGYFYANNTWDGNAMGNNPTVYPGDPRATQSKINYFLLYNKYNTTLRVMAYIENGTGSSAYNTIVATLRLLNNNNYSYSPTNAPGYGFPYNQAYNPKTNGIFNVYNKGSIHNALDQNTNVNEVSAPAIFPYGTTGDMIYADFQLSYDPCVCFFQSGLEVNFHSQMTANLTATGKYAGVNSNVNLNIANASTGNPNGGTVYGQNNTSGERFITSMFENGGAPQSMLQSYKDHQALKTDAGLLTNGNIKLGLEGLAGIMEFAAPYAGEYETYLAVGAKVVAFAATRIKEDTPEPEPNVTLAAGYLNLNGSITFNQTNYNGLDLSFATPGSKDADIMPEYSKHVGSVKLPDYPTYNEPTGLFTILNTPKVNFFNSITASSDGFRVEHDEFLDIDKTFFKWHKFYKYTYSIDPNQALQYKLNPVVDASQSKIYVGLEVIGADKENWISTANSAAGTMAGCANQQFVIHLDQPNENNNNSLDFIFDQTNTKANYQTRFFPIGCYNRIVGEADNSLDMEYQWTGNQAPNQNNVNNCFTIPGQQIGTFNADEIRLVVLLDLVSKPDAYGKTHRMAQIQKYKCNVTKVSSDPIASAPLNGFFQPIQSANNNLTLGFHSHSSGAAVQEIFSFGKITVNGDQWMPWSYYHKAYILAEKEIDVVGEVDIATAGDDLVLRIQQLPGVFNDCSPEPHEVSYEVLSSYCSSSEQYKGNELSGHSRAAIQQQNDLKDLYATTGIQSAEKAAAKDYKIGVFPNPTTNNINIGVATAYAKSIHISLENIAGMELLNKNFTTDGGYSESQLSLNEFPNGVYILKIADDKGRLIKTEKIILNR